MTDLLLVEKVDREAAADLIDAYWLGQDEGMKNLAISYRNGHTQGVWAQAFAAHRIEGFKQGIEAAAKVAETTRAYDDHLQRSTGCVTTGKRIATAIRTLSPSIADEVADIHREARKAALARFVAALSTLEPKL